MNKQEPSTRTTPAKAEHRPGDLYTPQWGVKIVLAGDTTVSAIIDAPDAIEALRTLMAAPDAKQPRLFERIEIFRVRNIGGPEL